MEKPHNPHDAIFRKTMSDIRVAREFMLQHLPKEVIAAMDQKALRLCEGTFIDKSLRKQFSDVLYSARFNGKLGYIYLLIEHQSVADKMMPWRILQYTINIMQKHIETHNTNVLPLVFPLVLYHGKEKYKHSTDIRDLIAAPQTLIDAYFLKPFHLIDLTTIEDEELREYLWSGILQYIEKHIYARDILPHLRAAEQWFRILEALGAETLTQSLLYYVGEAGKISDLAEFRTIILEMLPETGEKVVNAFEQLRTEGFQQGQTEGMEMGRTLGLQEGEKRGALQIAKRMLIADEDVELDFVAQITSLPLTTIRELQAEIESLETVD